jgi:hypothetical protein
MDRSEQLAVLGGVAADQWGLVTAAQAKSAGLSAVQLKRLTESGLLEIVGRGVYLVVAVGQPEHLEIKVAWLRLQPSVLAWQRSPGDVDSGVVSHASACQLHGLGDIPAPAVEISVPRRRTTTEPFVRLKTAPVDASDITVVDGLPVTTAARTITDLLRIKADGGHIGGVIADAERRGLISVVDLADQVQPYARRYGLPTGTDGRTLIEHLAGQAGEVLHSQEINRAARQGFTSALQLIGSRLGPPPTDSGAQQLANPLSAAVLAAIRDALPSAFQGAGAHLESINAAVAAAVRNSVRPESSYPGLRRALHDLNAPTNPTIAAAIQANQAVQAILPSASERVRPYEPEEPDPGIG